MNNLAGVKYPLLYLLVGFLFINPSQAQPSDITQTLSKLTLTWKMDSLMVNEYVVPSKIVEWESTLQFTKDGSLLATAGTSRRLNHFELIDPLTIIMYPEDGSDTIKISITELTLERLVLVMETKGAQKTRMVLVPKP